MKPPEDPARSIFALQCKDVMYTVSKLQRNGVDFLRVPDTYYDALPSRVGPVEECLHELRSGSAYSWIATRKAISCRFSRSRSRIGRTVFFEVIQRKGSRGFGKGNFKALFESIEMEQARRGNL